MPAASSRPFSQSFANGILVRTAEGGKDQFSRVGLARGHGHAGATLVNLAKGIEVPEIQFRINSVHVEVEGDGNDVEIAGALAVAKKRALDTIRPGKKPELGRGHASATIVMGVQADDQAIAFTDIAAH